MIPSFVLWGLIYQELADFSRLMTYTVLRLREGNHLSRAPLNFFYETPKVLMLLVLVGLLLAWVSLGMFGVKGCSLDGGFLYRLKFKGLSGALGLGAAYGTLSGSCTFGYANGLNPCPTAGIHLMVDFLNKTTSVMCVLTFTAFSIRVIHSFHQHGKGWL